MINALLAALALLGLQAREQPIRDPIKNWTLHRREINSRTGQEEVVAIVRGEEAIPRDKEVFEVRGVRAQYFTEPRTKDEKSQAVNLTANRALLHGRVDRLELTDRVTILHEDGTSLEAPAALVLFHKRYCCLPCRTEATAPGKCPGCKAELKPRTFTTLEVEEEFSLVRPGMRLSGRQLKADDRLGQLTVGRQGSLEMKGRAASITGKAPSPPKVPRNEVTTGLRCSGPLTIHELNADRTLVSVDARDSVRILRRDGTGTTTTVTADRAEITARRRPDLKTGKHAPRPDAEKVAARGHLTLSDGKDLQASAEAMDWELKDDIPALGVAGGPAGALMEVLGAARYDTVHLSGTPVALAQGANRVRARTVEIERPMGRTVFAGDVSGDIVPPDAPETPPLKLASQTLMVLSAPSAAGVRPQDLEARGEVRLQGLMEKDGGPPARAEADRFSWSLLEQRGLLEGRPFVRVVQGRNLILAPRILLEGKSTIVLKGPKRFRLVQSAEGRETATTVTAGGDVVIDSARGRITLTDRCDVRSSDFRLLADRMEIALAPDGKGLQALYASGNVRARRSGEAVTLYGDRVRYDPRERALSVVGFPAAMAEGAGRSVVAREVRFNEQARTTELRGGEAGILIVVDEAKK